MEGYVFDASICRQCRGLCCRAHAGAWADPLRFAALFLDGRSGSPASVRRQLHGQDIVLRDYSGVAVPSPRSTAAGCLFLGPEGCRLSEEERPCQCLALIPDLATLIDGECRCTLPGEFTYGAVRARWQAWWDGTAPAPR